ncbi:MAG: hypothetical protein ACK4WD_10120 [Flavobacteriales bacterium]|jgi:hypothetical protein
MRNLFFIGILLIFSCAPLKQVGLYDYEDLSAATNIDGFTQLSIFKDNIDADVWFTKNQACLNVQQERSTVYSGNGAIAIKWNKQAGGCPWLGLGIGWDGWTGKDISQIYKKAAISFRVKTNQKPMNQLPWAVGLEDFAGSQAWTGATEDVVVNGPISNEWTQVLIPFTKFNPDAGNFDMYSVKQLMIQFESSGEVFIDQIEIVELR